MNILLIDNNDSFTRNLEHLLVAAIAEAQVSVRPYADLPAPRPRHPGPDRHFTGTGHTSRLPRI